MLACMATAAVLAPCAALADEPWSRQVLNTLGTPGILDMPTAHPLRDADAGFTVAAFNDTSRYTFYFQITPRLSGVFRYSGVENFTGRGAFFDRSFDLRYALAEETPRRPAITVGLQDFGGTGIYAAEYVVATKTTGRWRTTLGLGWGRLGSQGGFNNPLGLLSKRFETRPNPLGGINGTGQLDASNWFRGDAALFGGVQYWLNDRTILSAEYSSDAYVEENSRIGFEQDIPLNFGASYRFRSGVEGTAALLYGNTLALQLSYVTNAKAPGQGGGGTDPAIAPLRLRAPGEARDLGWTTQPDAPAILQDNTAQIFAAAGLSLDAITTAPRSVEVRFRNETYPSSAQAVGRAARLLTTLMPASIETFVLVPVTENGIAASKITLRRSDLEELENAPDGSWQSYARAEIADAGTLPAATPAAQSFARFNWSFGPFLDTALFDPAEPIRVDVGLALAGRYEPRPGLVFSGRLKQQIISGRADLPPSNSVIEPVRSNVGRYAAEGKTALETLTAAYYYRPGTDLYGRITAGYLESMFGGLSTEVLWKPVESRWAMGGEVNYVRQRDFDQKFGFQDYDVVTGHASAYWDIGNGFHAQVDAGRYLAGDWGSTLSLDREFANGVRVGAFATLTDVSFEDFGEGSFDKGIRFTIPVSLITGRATQERISRTIRPVTRDGGARLNVDGRLYESVRGFHQAPLQEQWGRFWR